MKANKAFLFADFPPVTRSEWEAKIKEDLKGSDYERKLVSKPVENFKIQPYYRADDLTGLKYLDQLPGNFPFVRGSKTGSNSWEIRQDFMADHIDTTVLKAKMAIERGVTAIGFDLTTKDDLTYHDIKKLISGIDFKEVSLNFIVKDNGSEIINFLQKALREAGISSDSVKGSLGFDPLGHITSQGIFYRSETEDFTIAGNLLSEVCRNLPGFRVISVNSNILSNAGATAVQELGFGLSMIAGYLTILTDHGYSAGDIAKHLQWNMGVGSDYFMEIAKIRAARLLFSGLLSAYDPAQAETAPVYIHSITTDWNKTLYDANVNMLRLTTEAMAATLGGCDSLFVKPYDSCYRKPGELAERIARNIQIILREEVYFDKVIDPAAGSYYIETLTDALVEHAWKLFLQVDGQGGYLEALRTGFVSADINATTSKRLDLVSTRKEVLVGTNQYPKDSEKVAQQIQEKIAFGEPVVPEIKAAEPVKTVRAAVEFEKLRLAVEGCKGRKPRVFMLTIGNPAMRLARSQFACNFFACGGYDIIDNQGFQTTAEGVEAALNNAADLIVICSSDDEYATIAPEVLKLTDRKAIVVIAGAPASMEELKAQGITEFIHMRSNVLETLKRFSALLGIV
jgi:methylmalonyl-CoA mutase